MAETLASDQARIFYQLISHSCFVQFCRNVGMNDNLQLRSEILVHVFCFPWLFSPFAPTECVLWVNIPMNKVRLENKPKLRVFVFAFLTTEKSDDRLIIMSEYIGAEKIGAQNTETKTIVI